MVFDVERAGADRPPPLEQPCEPFTEPAQLRLVDIAPICVQTFRHAGDHELHHRPVQGTAGGRHLLDNVVTIRTFIKHALDAADLPLEPAHASAQRADIRFGQREAARLVLPSCHGAIIPLGVPLRIPPGVC